MPVSRKSKKNISKKRKNVKRNKKTRKNKHIKKMRGGGYIKNDEKNIYVYNIEENSIKNSNGKLLITDLALFGHIVYKNEFNLKDNLNLLDQAAVEMNESKRIELLDTIVESLKKKINDTVVIKLPNGVFLRTPIQEYKNKIDTEKKYKKGYAFSLPLFETKDGFLYLYSFIPKSQLEDITVNGLNSKFGGIYWHLMDYNTNYNEYKDDERSYDMCKFFLNTTSNNLINRLYNYSIHIQISIVIPIEKSYDINLSAFFSFGNSNGDGSQNVFFVGIIDPNYINKYDSQINDYIPLISNINNVDF